MGRKLKLLQFDDFFDARVVLLFFLKKLVKLKHEIEISLG
jgi:hypothetical protein